jgi:hypothetical protein
VRAVRKAYRIIGASERWARCCCAPTTARRDPSPRVTPALVVATVVALLGDADARVAEAAAADPSLPRPAMHTLLTACRRQPLARPARCPGPTAVVADPGGPCPKAGS